MLKQLEQQLNSYLQERENILQVMDKMRADFDSYRERVIELNGSIQATETMIRSMGEKSNDSESETETGSDVNEG